MAKVVAPLGSFSASGKIGKSLVFFSHLGRNVVRGLVTPANPMSGGQGMTRLFLGAIGRAARVPYVGGPFLTALKTVVPAGQTWVSAMVSYVMGAYADVDAFNTAATGHSKSAVFTSQAELLGLTPVTVSYSSGDTEVTPGAQLYALAVYAAAINAQNPGIFGEAAPWDEVLSAWTTTDIVAFVADVTATS
jgi:hypothetical protein